MSCKAIQQDLTLYSYGELGQQDEERIEQHLSGCEACRRELGRLKAVMSALDESAAPVAPELLAECRHDLMRAVYQEPAAAPSRGNLASGRYWRDVLAAFALPLSGWRRPVGALALVALGFLAARFTLTHPGTAPFGASPDVVVSSVRSVEPAGDGRVRIAFDETRQRTMSGDLADNRIRALLETALRKEENPGVRVETMSVLRNGPVPEEIRDLLLYVAQFDANPGVRLKAVESLRAYAGDPSVGDVLAKVLLRDENAAVRMLAIELLAEHKPASIVGVFQNVVEREPNSYIRMQIEKALQEMNASVGTF